MDLFSVLTLLGGLAFFLYGMHVMSGGLEKLAGGKLEKTLGKMTSSPLRGLLLGAGVTAVIQSSSAVTVMLVGLVNSGIMKLSQSVGVVMGANIGTTMTAWILSLAGLEGDNIIIKLLKPSSFAPALALIGIIFLMTSGKSKKKDVGAILVGFAVLMYGMTMMSDAVKPLSDMPQFASVLTAFENPLLGVLVGTAFTAVIQSSSASVGILQALSLTGAVSYSVAIPIIMGQNIGTCVTSLISCIGVNKNAKRVAALHVSFNIIGTAVCLVIYLSVNTIADLGLSKLYVDPSAIAIVHSIFNIFTTIILFPFKNLLVKLACKLVRGGGDKNTLIDERLLNTPSFAVSECGNQAVKMSKTANGMLLASMENLFAFSEKNAAAINANEDILDKYEDALGTYLVKLSSHDLTDADSRRISMLLHTIGDFERIGDHAVNLVDVAREIHDKEIVFSPEADAEIANLGRALTEILEITMTAFEKNDVEAAMKVEPLEQVIDALIAESKSRHIERLQKGSCTIELGFVLSDLLTNYERVSDHCSNIAVAVVEVAGDNFDSHEYLGLLKSPDNESFNRDFAEYRRKYKI